MLDAHRLLPALGASVAVYALFRLVKFLWTEYQNPIWLLPGPKSRSLLYGNAKETKQGEFAVAQERWAEEYGPTFRYTGLLGRARIWTVDTKALNHILAHDFVYQKPATQRYTIGKIVGHGLLIAEGQDHRKQRRIINPAFGPAQIRGFTGIFWDKSIELRDAWNTQIDSGDGTTLDVLSWMGRATLDIIGLAGFNYDFKSFAAYDETRSIGDQNNARDLGKAMASVLFGISKMDIWRLLKMYIPPLRLFRTKLDRDIDSAQQTMDRIARELLEDSKRELAATGSFSGAASSTRARDILSLMVRANTAKDLSDAQRLSDDDVVAQIPTFFLAGYETTSTSTTMALFALAQNKAAQNRLRAELLAVPSETPSSDDLNALPYLDCVVREVLRVYPPAAQSMRVATQDDVIPLAQPFTDLNGVIHDTLRVKKGTTFVLPVVAVNRRQEIWGVDAKVFRPERWEDENLTTSIPGIWSHMLSFLGGARACIGFRFALIEMKCLLFVLIRAFEFELAVPEEDIGAQQGIVLRPFVKSEKAKGHQMPLRVRRVEKT
ncbi:Cytochrome P450 [Mycena kentingensis (nom. inval.)]|nr:Cytochrome P450 [Mycena kentingensis (nom. inval.)]